VREKKNAPGHRKIGDSGAFRARIGPTLAHASGYIARLTLIIRMIAATDIILEPFV